MATFYPYVPSNVAPFQFQPTLGGVQYAAVVTANLSNPNRPYLNLYTITGSTWVLTVAIVGSLTAAPINLVAGYVSGGVLWFDALNSQFVTSP